MKDRTQKIVRLSYSVFLGVFTVGIAAALLGQLLAIWFGKGFFSREVVGEAFRAIMVPGILWILAVIAGGVLFCLYPAAQPKGKADIRYSVYRLKKKLPQNGDSEEVRNLARYTLIRNLVWVCVGVVCLICAVCVLVYLFDADNYHKIQPNRTMWHAFIHVFPFIAVSFALAVGAAIWEGQSAKRELKLIRAYNAKNRAAQKSVAAQEDPKTHSSELAAALELEAQTGSKFKRTLAHGASKAVLYFKTPSFKLRFLVAAIGIALVIWGICNGGMSDVLKKAVSICTECIGLG